VLQGLGVKPEEQGKLIKEIQQNLQVEPVITSMSAAAAASPTPKPRSHRPQRAAARVQRHLYGQDAERAQKICNAMTSLIVNENLRSRSECRRAPPIFSTAR
jgi:hypothetical protein